MGRVLVFTAVILLGALSGCVPIGYNQSPRVLPGIEIGPSISIRTDTSGGMLPFNPRFGIRDRCRVGISAGLYESNKELNGDLMVNLIDRGEPQLFRNIAVGALLSGGAYEDWPTEQPWMDGEITASCGVLLGTKRMRSVWNSLELVVGAGVTYRNKYHILTPSLSDSIYTVIGNDSLELLHTRTSDTQYLLDFAPSVHWKLGRRQRIGVSIGMVISPEIKRDFIREIDYQHFWIDSDTVVYHENDTLFRETPRLYASGKRFETSPEKSEFRSIGTLSVAMSVRFGGNRVNRVRLPK